MNPESPKTPREELEIRLTALLLGELPDEEAAAWRAGIATNPELAKLHDRLQQTISLVREATAKVAEPAAEQTTPLQLSEERREKLLAHFKTVKPKAFVAEKPKRRLRAVELAAAVAILGVLAAISVPTLSNFRREETLAFSPAYTVDTALTQGEANQMMVRENHAIRAGTPDVSAGGQIISPQNIVGYVNKPLTEGQGKVANSLLPPPAGPTLGSSALFDRSGPSSIALTSSGGSRERAANSAKSLPQDLGRPATESMPALRRENAGAGSSRLSAASSQIVLPSADESGSPGAIEVAKVAEEKVSLRDKDTRQKEGNAVLADGSVQAISRSRLQEALRNSSDAGLSVGVDAVDEGKKGVTTWATGMDEQRMFRERYGLPAQEDKGISPAITLPLTPTSQSAIAVNGAEQPSFAGRGSVDEAKRTGDRGIELSVGDPEWAGTLARPDSAHSSTNQFLGRYAYSAPQAAQPERADQAYRDLNRSAVVQQEQFYSDFSRAPAAIPPPAAGAAIAVNVAEPSTFAGRGVSPTTGQPADDLSRDRATLGQTLTVTRADPTQPRNYGLETAKRGSSASAGGTGGGGGGAGNLVAQQDVEHARGRGFSLLGPQEPPVLEDKPGQALAEDLVAGFDFDGAPALRAAKPQESVPLPAGAAMAEPEGDKVPVLGDMPSFGVLHRNQGSGTFDRLTSDAITAYKLEVPRVSVQESLRRQPSSVVLPSVQMETAEAQEKAGEANKLVQDRNVLIETGKPAEAGVRIGKTTWGDYNKDGFLDLLVAKQVPGQTETASARGKDSKEAIVGVKPAPVELRQLAKTRGRPEALKQHVAGLEPQVQAAQKKVHELRGQLAISDMDAAGAGRTDKSREYFEAKENLDEQLRFRGALNGKLAAEGVDLSLPKTSLVEILDRATPPTEKTGFWRRLGAPIGGTYESAARVRVERDNSEIQGFTTREPFADAYDPYFIQTESGVIQSEAVLAQAVDKLNLDQKWAKTLGENLKKDEAIALLKQRLDLKPNPKTSVLEIRAKSDKPDEAAAIANAVADAYANYRQEKQRTLTIGGVEALKEQFAEADNKVAQAQRELNRVATESKVELADIPIRKPATNAPIPQPEIQTSENAFSTFSLNVSDVSFKLAAASLEKGQMPDQASIRSEEFINAFDYHDPEPPLGMPVAFAWERAHYPFAHNRDLLRFSLKTGAVGRQAGRAMNLVLLLDNSGSMERADRVHIIREALRVLAGQLQPQDKISVITFARTPRLWVDGASGAQAGEVAEQVSGLTPQGGTNLEEAMNLAYQTALRHYVAGGINRVVVLTDGAANLGNVEPESLKQKVETHRKQGIALDCFGIGWEGFNDDLLEVLSRNGDGRYGFINSPEEAATEFAGQLAGTLQVAASDVKVQVEFNPARVTAYRQIGYAKHQLTKEQFRDNTVDAAEIAAQEAGNALYTAEVNPAGEGPLCIVRVRFKFPGTVVYREHEWAVPYTGSAVSLEEASPAMRLAASASAFSEWLVASPFAAEVTPDALLGYLSGVKEVYGVDARPKKLEWMIRQAKSIEGK